MQTFLPLILREMDLEDREAFMDAEDFPSKEKPMVYVTSEAHVCIDKKGIFLWKYNVSDEASQYLPYSFSSRAEALFTLKCLGVYYTTENLK